MTSSTSDDSGDYPTIGLRNTRQQSFIQELHVLEHVPTDVLRYAYRQYRIELNQAAAEQTSRARGGERVTMSPTAEGRDTIALVPLGIDEAERSATSSSFTAETGGVQVNELLNPERRLCLFNVLVALEWYPSKQYLRRLEWAFRHASNFLYDVTDGYFAFGTVLIGGPEWMNCADIQIMASNRLWPRSWVSGLHDPTKYLPLRLGRGLWTKTNRFSIPWDEPESYRTLIHEWAHYALELKDEYLDTRQVSLPHAFDSSLPPEHVLLAGDYTLVVPQISPAIQSIMATLEGTSELVPRAGGDRTQRKNDVWQTIINKQRYPFLELSLDKLQGMDGPERFPLPLPIFHHAFDRQNGDHTAVTEGKRELLLSVPEGIQAEHCWVYIVQGELTAPTNIIAQGTLDAHALSDGFRLLGAQQNDTVVLIGQSRNGQPAVLCGQITGMTNEPDRGETYADIAAWRLATPTPFPEIDVLPGPPDESAAPQTATIGVRVHGAEDASPDQVIAFPLGQASPQVIPPDEFRHVPSLDGHVLMTWQGGQQLMICTFSQGGNPPSGNPTVNSPITAGSSEGNVMLFFSDKTSGRTYGRTKVVTTLNHADTAWDRLPNGAEPRSYVFSLASNTSLPAECHPTLVMNYDAGSLRPDGDLLIYRQVDGGWEPIPTYAAPGRAYAAAPLNVATAASLFAVDTPRVERYRLYWTPRT